MCGWHCKDASECSRVPRGNNIKDLKTEGWVRSLPRYGQCPQQGNWANKSPATGAMLSSPGADPAV